MGGNPNIKTKRKSCWQEACTKRGITGIRKKVGGAKRKTNTEQSIGSQGGPKRSLDGLNRGGMQKRGLGGKKIARDSTECGEIGAVRSVEIEKREL